VGVAQRAVRAVPRERAADRTAADRAGVLRFGSSWSAAVSRASTTATSAGRSAPASWPKKPVSTTSGSPSTTSCPTACARRRSRSPRTCSTGRRGSASGWTATRPASRRASTSSLRASAAGHVSTVLCQVGDADVVRQALPAWLRDGLGAHVTGARGPRGIRGSTPKGCARFTRWHCVRTL
jgi:hypothetical protein